MGRRYWHWWTQNLKRTETRRRWDCRLINWRGHIWRRYRGDDMAVWDVGYQVCVPSSHVGVSLRFDYDDEPLHLFVGFFGLFALFVSINTRWSRRLRDWATPKRPDGKPTWDDRTLEVNIHHGAIWWTIWYSDNTWRSTDSKWRRGSWHPIDTLFGNTKHHEEVLEEADVTIPLPEGDYQAHIQLQRRWWTRPRWPFRLHEGRYANIDIIGNPPMFAGKGENSWDLDDDAIYGMSTPANTFEEAVDVYRRAVLDNRKRYGMPQGLLLQSAYATWYQDSF